MAHDAFISYSSKDKPTADAACALLESSGIRCWIAPRDVMPGRDWGEALVDAIAQSRVMVLIFSAHANHSPQVRREVERAVNKGVVIVPFRIENVTPCKALEYFISVPHWMDAYGGPLDEHLKRLVKTVRALIDSGSREHSLESAFGDAARGALPARPRIPVPGRPQPAKRQAPLVALVGAAAVVSGGLLYWNLWPFPGQATAHTQESEPAPTRSAIPELATPQSVSRVVALPPASHPSTTAPAPTDPRADARRRTIESDAKLLHLSSIAVIGKQRFCTIDGNFVREGETYNDFLVQKILTDRIIIAREGFRFEVRPPPQRQQENDSSTYSALPPPRDDPPAGGPRFDGPVGPSGPANFGGPPPGGPPNRQGPGPGRPMR